MVTLEYYVARTSLTSRTINKLMALMGETMSLITDRLFHSGGTHRDARGFRVHDQSDNETYSPC